jgi:hypothetical protein
MAIAILARMDDKVAALGGVPRQAVGRRARD